MQSAAMFLTFALGLLAWFVLARALRGHSLRELGERADTLDAEGPLLGAADSGSEPTTDTPAEDS